MLHLEFTVVKLLIILPVAYVAGLFSSWLVHFLQHQTIAGVPLYLPHFQHHHLRVDDPDEWLRQTGCHPGAAFRSSILGHGMWFFLASCIVALYAVLFTPWVALVFAVTGIGVGFFHWYVHQAAHDEGGDSWLSRSEWLQRERVFHEVHHLTSGDFANAKNFAFGDRLSRHLIDYVMGTLDGSREPRPLGRAGPRNGETQLAPAAQPCGSDVKRLATQSR